MFVVGNKRSFSLFMKFRDFSFSLIVMKIFLGFILLHSRTYLRDHNDISIYIYIYVHVKGYILV